MDVWSNLQVVVHPVHRDPVGIFLETESSTSFHALGNVFTWVYVPDFRLEHFSLFLNQFFGNGIKIRTVKVPRAHGEVL